MPPELSLIISSFIAGILTFLAPCTLPLLPGYLSFISGVSFDEIEKGNRLARRKVVINGLSYVLGFSLVFILLGTLFGLGGSSLVQYRDLLARIGGVLIIFFGILMLNIIKPSFLSYDWHLRLPRFIKPGNSISSFLFGATFAFGWTPCVGPILGFILTLAASSATVIQGAFLLAVFSLGLAIPFLIFALGIGRMHQYLNQFDKYSRLISMLGGILLVIIGISLVTDSFGRFIYYIYGIFSFINYEGILKFL